MRAHFKPARETRVRFAGQDWPPASQTFTWGGTASYTNASSTTLTSTWDNWSVSASTFTITSARSLASTWATWSTGTTQGECLHVPAITVPYRPPAMTPEQVAARAAAEEHARQRHVAEQARRAAAIVKADKLLDSILSDVQRAHLCAHGYFIVRSPTGQLYRIRRGWSGNVDRLAPDGRVIERMCAHPSMYTPDGDNMAGQKLMLESADEALFLRIANRTAHHGSDRVPPEVLAPILALS